MVEVHIHVSPSASSGSDAMRETLYLSEICTTYNIYMNLLYWKDLLQTFQFFPLDLVPLNATKGHTKVCWALNILIIFTTTVYYTLYSIISSVEELSSAKNLPQLYKGIHLTSHSLLFVTIFHRSQAFSLISIAPSRSIVASACAFFTNTGAHQVEDVYKNELKYKWMVHLDTSVQSPQSLCFNTCCLNCSH